MSYSILLKKIPNVVYLFTGLTLFFPLFPPTFFQSRTSRTWFSRVPSF